ncbi:N-acylglucosamine-6-phosphate 2-epimerase [Brevinema andersonii]|uniref:Putative N-acetylmannosamine-6-phosphate 2-epimerase n=1 Tax=Brevinema andersonii TaxID=34097 RepID=A0A1I1EPY0_BREAD|nr:N-acetylmannosamine-6-phosphate 2-epimerase [Brevinema andersonii]SFB87568.1 N-acylglucosamine-6-phosphate 2-epimerase [Brevinema andersonii]
MNVLDSLKGGLVVSCQALPHEPLHSSFIMSKMALAAVLGGAKGIRANTVEDIEAIRKEVNVPIIGIIKQEYDNNPIFITPTLKEVTALVNINVDILAVDTTRRIRPDGLTTQEFLQVIKETFPNVLIMGDCADEEDVLLAMEYCDCIGTTLYGYTDYTKNCNIADNDFDYFKQVVKLSSKPVIAEGNIDTPEKARKCLEFGAWCVVVGGAITRPLEITEKFIAAISS